MELLAIRIPALLGNRYFIVCLHDVRVVALVCTASIFRYRTAWLHNMRAKVRHGVAVASMGVYVL